MGECPFDSMIFTLTVVMEAAGFLELFSLNPLSSTLIKLRVGVFYIIIGSVTTNFFKKGKQLMSFSKEVFHYAGCLLRVFTISQNSTIY